MAGGRVWGRDPRQAEAGLDHGFARPGHVSCAHTQPHTHSHKDPVLTRCLPAKGAPEASEALSLTPVSKKGLGSPGSSGGNKVLGPGPAQQSSSVLRSARRQGGEREGGEEEREGAAGGGRRENAEVLKGTLTSFLGFPWQQHIPQMISV
jgi:hypothetical protein